MFRLKPIYYVLLILVLFCSNDSFSAQDVTAPVVDSERIVFLSKGSHAPVILNRTVRNDLSNYRGRSYLSESVTRDVRLLRDSCVVVLTISIKKAAVTQRIQLVEYWTDVALYDYFGEEKWSKHYDFPVDPIAFREEYNTDYYIDAKLHSKTKNVLLLIGGYAIEKLPNYFDLINEDGEVIGSYSWEKLGIGGVSYVIFVKHGNLIIFNAGDNSGRVYYAWDVLDTSIMKEFRPGRNYEFLRISDSGEITFIDPIKNTTKKYQLIDGSSE
ncbi:MAG: hypothetical protein HQ556_04080 [Candidatus Marinimicrobia bacterium]|nr:hypothetical protein [Candidatus Neomarinimicrobiota bacterium]